MNGKGNERWTLGGWLEVGPKGEARGRSRTCASTSKGNGARGGGVIRGHCRRVVLRRASHSHSRNHRAEIGSLVVVVLVLVFGLYNFWGVFVYLQIRKVSAGHHPGDSEVA
jgi:hypothetical protein